MASSSYRSWADRIVAVPPVDTKETELESLDDSSAPASPQSLATGGRDSSMSESAVAAPVSGERGSRQSSSAVEEGAKNIGGVFLAPVDAHQSSGDDIDISAAAPPSSYEHEAPPDIIDLTAISDVASTEQITVVIPEDDRANQERHDQQSETGGMGHEMHGAPSSSSEGASLESSPQNPIFVEDADGHDEDPTGRADYVNNSWDLPQDVHPAGPEQDGLVPLEDDSVLIMKENHNDITATTSMDVTGVTVNDDDEDDDDENNDSHDELKYSDTSVRTDEHEIAFGGLGESSVPPDTANGFDDDDDDDDDDDELNLDALLAKTADEDEAVDGHDDVDSAAEGDDANEVDSPRQPNTNEDDDEMDDLLNELLDNTHNAAEELDDLLNEQQQQAQSSSESPAIDTVPHVGDVDEAKVVIESDLAPPTIVSTPSNATTVSTVSATPSKPSAVRHVQPLAHVAKGSDATASPAAREDTMPAAKVTRPNLSARIPGTRRYVAPSSSKAVNKKGKPSLTVEIPEPEDPNKEATPSPSRRRWSPKSDPNSTPPPRIASRHETEASATSVPAKQKKNSILKTFTRALSSGQQPKLKKSPPGELSPRAQAVLPTLKPIEPTSRLLKETSASVAQKRHRFIPPPLSFPTIGEVMRAIHSGAFDRKATAPGAADPSSSPRSPRRGGGTTASRVPADCGGSIASSRSRPRKKSAL